MKNKYLESRMHEYFTYNGEKYHYGTKFKMKIKNKYGFDEIVNTVFKGYSTDTEGYYAGKLSIWYNTPLDEAENYNFKSGLWYRNGIYMSEKELCEAIVEILPGNHCIELETKRKKYVKDTDDPNLMAKWGMYIFFMIWSSIFNGRVLGWVLLTIVFFVWRHKYREENSYYV